MKNVRILLWGVVALVSAGAIWLALNTINPSTETKFSSNYTLSKIDGTKFSGSDMHGRPHLVFFGFTHCPEVCPTTLFEITGWLKALGDEAGKLDVYFISVDPERDTAELLGNYLSSFDPKITALTGSLEEIDSAAKAFHVYYKKVPLDTGDYTVDHTASVYLMKADGSFKGTIAYQENTDIALEKIRNLLKS